MSSSVSEEAFTAPQMKTDEEGPAMLMLMLIQAGGRILRDLDETVTAFKKLRFSVFDSSNEHDLHLKRSRIWLVNVVTLTFYSI